MDPLSTAYEFIAGRPLFAPLNTLLYRLALKGLGVWNGPGGERHFLRQVLTGQTAPVVLNVGANEGQYARMLLQVNPAARVHAFEPHPVTFNRLAACAAALGFTPHRLALGEKEGSGTIYDYANADGSQHASLHENVIRNIHKGTPTAHPIEVTTLDAFCRKLAIRNVALLKIDVEGHELAVLKGAADALKSGMIAAIQFEFNEMNVVSRTFVQDFLDILPGYSLHRLLPRGSLPLAACRALEREIFGAQNIIAIPNATEGNRASPRGHGAPPGG